MSYPKTIVGSPVTSRSKEDYLREKPFFLVGGAKWRSTAKAKEKKGDRLMFTNMPDNLVEFFEIEEKHMGLSQGRPEWFGENYTAVLFLSKKIGEMYCTRYAELAGYKFNPAAPFIRSTINCRWNRKLEEELTGKKIPEEKSKAKKPKEIIAYEEDPFTKGPNWNKWNKPGWVYAIIEMHDRFERGPPIADDERRRIKMGITTVNLTRRRRQLNTGNGRVLEVDRSIRCPDPKKLEKYLHDCFTERHIHGEWYHISLTEIRKLYDFVNSMGKGC